MPSKGINLYSYISVDDYQVEFTVPNGKIVNTAADNFVLKDLEVDAANVAGPIYNGRFQWRALKNGQEVAKEYNNINAITGNLVGGTMTSTRAATSILHNGVIISYGFYDAGDGGGGLPNHDQCWVTIVKSHVTWMGEIAPPGSTEESKPFARFVLAAPHDGGMNNMQNADVVLKTVDRDTIHQLSSNLKQLSWLSDIILKEGLIYMLSNIIYNLAITQKDTISTMLALGARYFEFRPADVHPLFKPSLPNQLYFQHFCIPGISFVEFLNQQVRFLDYHPTEIVTLHIRWDGIANGCRKPSSDEVRKLLDAACAKAHNQPLSWGDRTCFTKSISTLRSTGHRLIYLLEAPKYDSWSEEAYATLSASPILGRFESMNTAGQADSDITVLQCQATSTDIRDVVIYSVLASNAATSCLSSTKAMLDTKTLPWIRDHALDRLQAERIIVIMNDWIDGATTDLAVELSRRRLAAK